jgi:hypothetical protein
LPGPTLPHSTGTEGRFDAPHIAILIGEDGKVGVAEYAKLILEQAGLIPTDLKQDRTAGSQEAATVPEDAPQDVGAVGAAVVGKRGLERERVALEKWELGSRYVRNNSHDHVNAALEISWHGFEEVAPVDLDAVGRGAPHRVWVKVGGHHPSVRTVYLQDLGDGAAPRAEIDGCAVGREALDRSPRKGLAEPAWHVHVRIDVNFNSAECDSPGDPGEWLAGEAASNSSLKDGGIARREGKQFPRLLLRRDETFAGEQRAQRRGIARERHAVNSNCWVGSRSR